MKLLFGLLALLLLLLLLLALFSLASDDDGDVVVAEAAEVGVDIVVTVGVDDDDGADITLHYIDQKHNEHGIEGRDDEIRYVRSDNRIWMEVMICTMETKSVQVSTHCLSG